MDGQTTHRAKDALQHSCSASKIFRRHRVLLQGLLHQIRVISRSLALVL